MSIFTNIGNFNPGWKFTIFTAIILPILLSLSFWQYQRGLEKSKLESFINKYSSRRMYRDDDATNGLYSSRGDGAPDRIQVEHVPGVSIPVMLYGKDQDTIKSTPMPNNEMDIITMDDDEV